MKLLIQLYFMLFKSKRFLVAFLLIASLLPISVLYFYSNDLISRSLSLQEPDAAPVPKPKILFWTTFFGRSDPFLVEDAPSGEVVAMDQLLYRWLECPFVCENTIDKEELATSDAVVFHLRDEFEPLPVQRTRSQKWVFFSWESPLHAQYPAFVESMFNWTMTYSRRSDVFLPYGGYVKRNRSRTGTPEDDVQTPSPKRKLAAWIASNCETHSKREKLFTKLNRHVDVDVYGQCGTRACPDGVLKCFHAIADQYVFYLAWENSLCDDYVTEKVWNALFVGLVPVVYGGADYRSLLPPSSYVDVMSFKSVKELADYLLYLSGNATALRQYTRWREDYSITISPMGWCTLCERLHRERERPTDTTVTLSEVWSSETRCSKKDHFRQWLSRA